jgi:hypothetical protein
MTIYRSTKIVIRASAIWTLGLFLTFGTPAAVQAGFMTSLSEQVDFSGGLYTYTYTLSNLAASTDTLGAFKVNVDPSAVVSSITAPTNWLSFFDTTNNLVEWVSPDSTTDLQPNSAGVFSFASSLPPVPQDYLAVGFSNIGIDFNTGSTLGPGLSTVPEPSSVTLLAIGIAGMAASGSRWRKVNVPGWPTQAILTTTPTTPPSASFGVVVSCSK